MRAALPPRIGHCLRPTAPRAPCGTDTPTPPADNAWPPCAWKTTEVAERGGLTLDFPVALGEDSEFNLAGNTRTFNLVDSHVWGGGGDDLFIGKCPPPQLDILVGVCQLPNVSCHKRSQTLDHPGGGVLLDRGWISTDAFLGATPSSFSLSTPNHRCGEVVAAAAVVGARVTHCPLGLEQLV